MERESEFEEYIKTEAFAQACARLKRRRKRQLVASVIIFCCILLVFVAGIVLEFLPSESKENYPVLTYLVGGTALLLGLAINLFDIKDRKVVEKELFTGALLLSRELRFEQCYRYGQLDVWAEFLFADKDGSSDRLSLLRISGVNGKFEIDATRWGEDVTDVAIGALQIGVCSEVKRLAEKGEHIAAARLRFAVDGEQIPAGKRMKKNGVYYVRKGKITSTGKSTLKQIERMLRTQTEESV